MKLSGWIAIGVVVLSVLGAVAVHNTSVRQEASIIGANKTRQAVLSNISQKVQEVLKVKDMNVEDIQKTVTEQIKARAGEAGMQNLVLMLKEMNIAPSQEVVLKIVNIIDVGRETYNSKEALMNDNKTSACVYRNSFPKNIILGITGGARLNIGCFDGQDDYPPLMNDKAADSFRTGKDQGLF